MLHDSSNVIGHDTFRILFIYIRAEPCWKGVMPHERMSSKKQTVPLTPIHVIVSIAELVRVRHGMNPIHLQAIANGDHVDFRANYFSADPNLHHCVVT